jgi:hypothetical protein
MKRFTIAILALFYLSAASGATVHLHYCMGKLVNLELWQSEKKECSNCGMEKNNTGDDCCKDEHHQLKIKADQKTAPQLIEPFSSKAGLPVQLFQGAAPLVSVTLARLPFSHAPPEHSVTDLYLRHCIFRI